LTGLQDHARFVLQACDGLADAIERADDSKTIAACSYFTGAMGQFGSISGAMDTLVLGCTHYPFASNILQSIVGANVCFLEGGTPVARQTRRLLTERDWLIQGEVDRGDAPDTFFVTTGSSTNLQSAVDRWLQITVPVQSSTID
jgi:glutamate racemase